MQTITRPGGNKRTREGSSTRLELTSRTSPLAGAYTSLADCRQHRHSSGGGPLLYRVMTPSSCHNVPENMLLTLHATASMRSQIVSAGRESGVGVVAVNDAESGSLGQAVRMCLPP